MKNLLALLTLIVALLPNQADASRASFRYGLGLFASAVDSPVEVKVFGLTYQRELGILTWQIEGGGWTDSKEKYGRKEAFFGATSLGVDVKCGLIFAQSLWGVGAISQRDSLLGSYFNFTHDLIVGVYDKEDRRVGLGWKHLSNAGIFKPNIGRDFINLTLTVPI
jgi:hypothetical protein